MKVRYRRLVITLVASLWAGLTAAGGWSRATPTATPHAKAAARAWWRYGRPDARSRPGKPQGIEDSIANYLQELAKDKAKNFIIEQLGRKQPSDLDRVLAEIKALSAQLQATEARLSAQIAELEFARRFDDLTDLSTDVDHMYRDYFLPLVTAGIQLRAAQERQPPDQAAIQAAMAQYSQRKQRFENFADAIKLTTITDKIHNRVQPRTGKGILREYGTVIMIKRRIVNFTDSENVALMYTYLEEHQALATWMSIEAALSSAGDYDHAKTEIANFLQDFDSAKTHQRDPGETNGLLPAIPPGVVIDRGPDAHAPDYTTKASPMFTYLGGVRAYAPWGEQAWNPPVPPTVQVAVANANRSRLRGFAGWGVPSGAQVDGVFSGLPEKKTEASIAKYIYDIFANPNIPIPRPWIWISNTSAQRYCSETSTHKVRCRDVDAHAGKSTDDFSSNVHPRFNGFVNLGALFNEARGGLFLVRNTDQQYL